MLTLTTANMSDILDNGKMTDKFIYDTQSENIRFKNVKQEKFTDAAISRVFARSIHLKSSQLNVDNILLIAGKNRLKDINNPNGIDVTPYNHKKYNPQRNKLTIDDNSTISAKYSYLHISYGKLDNQGVINSSRILNISGVNANILNKNKLISKDQNYTFISTNFANGGMIVGNNIHDVTEVNNDSLIKLKVNLYSSSFGEKSLTFIDVANADNALNIVKDNKSIYPAEWNIVLMPQ